MLFFFFFFINVKQRVSCFFFLSSRRRHTRWTGDWSSEVCSSDLHRPSVGGREIWGKTVPYGQVWRAGANDNTTIAFTDDVSIEGKPLPAGIYGLHTIPDKEQWTIIFSKNSTSWGSFSYDEKEDA